VLDTTMNEDAGQIYRGNAAENLACCRHIRLNMLKAKKNEKGQYPAKAKVCR
jgi:predicted transposase YbfD/YdcC